MPFTGRGCANDHSNHSNRPAAAVQYGGGLATLEHGPCNEAVRAEEDINHPNIAEHPLLLWRAGLDGVRIRFPIVFNRIDLRPDRHEPRAVKAFYNTYRRLTRPRDYFQKHPELCNR